MSARNLLIVFFTTMLVAMVSVTVVASLDRGLFAAGAELWPDPWFRATLTDTYFAFLTVYLWMAVREKTWPRRLLWLALVLSLGTIAIAIYMLNILLRKPREKDPVASVVNPTPKPRTSIQELFALADIEGVAK
jgi:hypothetical protein